MRVCWQTPAFLAWGHLEVKGGGGGEREWEEGWDTERGKVWGEDSDV
jgi:hypothetical protein